MTPRTAGIPMASSAVTAPRSLRDDRKRTANEGHQESLDGTAFEDNREESREGGRGDRCDRVLGGDRTAVVAGVCIEW